MLLVVMLCNHTQLLNVRSIYRPSLNVLGDVLFVSQDRHDVNGGELEHGVMDNGVSQYIISGTIETE
jgi:hypothetical protein